MIAISRVRVDFQLSRSIEPRGDLPPSAGRTERASRVGEASRPDRALDRRAQHAVTGEPKVLPPDGGPAP